MVIGIGTPQVFEGSLMCSWHKVNETLPVPAPWRSVLWGRHAWHNHTSDYTIISSKYVLEKFWGQLVHDREKGLSWKRVYQEFREFLNLVKITKVVSGLECKENCNLFNCTSIFQHFLTYKHLSKEYLSW